MYAKLYERLSKHFPNVLDNSHSYQQCKSFNHPTALSDLVGSLVMWLSGKALA
jgi:hypothetical protein